MYFYSFVELCVMLRTTNCLPSCYLEYLPVFFFFFHNRGGSSWKKRKENRKKKPATHYSFKRVQRNDQKIGQFQCSTNYPEWNVCMCVWWWPSPSFLFSVRGKPGPEKYCAVITFNLIYCESNHSTVWWTTWKANMCRYCVTSNKIQQKFIYHVLIFVWLRIAL